MTRWLYHALARASWDEAALRGAVSPASLASEGFVHCSFRDLVVASARLYLGEDADVVVLQIDPRRLVAEGVRVSEASTPRGAMPHVYGPIPLAAVAFVLELDEVALGPDAVDEP